MNESKPDGREVWAADEIPLDVALDVIKLSAIDSRIRAAKAILESLFRELRELNPIQKRFGKYLNLELSESGFDSDTKSELRAYFGEQLIISKVETFAQITEAISAFDPEQIRLKKIASLKAELAEIEAKPSPTEIECEKHEESSTEVAQLESGVQS